MKSGFVVPCVMCHGKLPLLIHFVTSHDKIQNYRMILNLANCSVFMALFKVCKPLAQECHLGYYLGQHTKYCHTRRTVLQVSIMTAVLEPKITPVKDETELKFQSCRIFDGLLCYFHFYASHQLLIFHVIIEVPDRVYRESHYRKDENLGLFGLQMNEWPCCAGLQQLSYWDLTLGLGNPALLDKSSIIHVVHRFHLIWNQRVCNNQGCALNA